MRIDAEDSLIYDNPRVQKVYEAITPFAQRDSENYYSFTYWFDSFEKTQSTATTTVTSKDGYEHSHGVIVESVNIDILETMLKEFGPEKLLELITVCDNTKSDNTEILYQVYTLFSELCHDPENGAYSEELANSITDLPMQWLIDIAQKQEGL